jgi:hypothetical protein
MTDAYAHAPKILGAQMRDDVLQAIVSAVAAAQLEFCATRGQIKLIMHHQYLRRLDFVELCHGTDCTTADIHKCLRFEQMHFMPVHCGACDQAMKFAAHFKTYTMATRKLIHPPEPGVVARARIFFTGIPQPNNQFYFAHDEKSSSCFMLCMTSFSKLTVMAIMLTLMIKLAMTVSLSPTLSRLRARGRTNRYASFTLTDA